MTRCSACPGVNECLPPDGPVDADVLFIGEAPGINENKRKKVFIGSSGQELDQHYLPLAGLRRNSVLVTNAIRCLPTSARGKLNASRAKDLELLHTCAAHHLYPLIERVRPKAIVTLGAFAYRAVGLGQGDGPEVGHGLDIQHGIPTQSVWGIPVFPMFHPALGIHEPKKMIQIRTDWQRLKSFLRGTLKQPRDPYPHPDYREVTDVAEIQDIVPDRTLACDTESDRKRQPFCLTYSQQPGTGRLIRAGRTDILRAFSARLRGFQSEILFHNWLYDWPVVEAMGLALPVRRVVDTMSLVFHLGNLPQGLKALAFRELGMLMEDFDDVVTPHSKKKVLSYYSEAAATTWEKPEEEMVIDDKTGLWKTYKPQGMNTKLKRFFTDYWKAPETKDVFEMWTKNWVDQQAMIETGLGREWPGKCISHAPFSHVLFYACRDSDALLRLRPILRHMAGRVREVSQEHWRA